MKCLVFIWIIGFLKNGHIICTAFVQICIFIRIHRINFKSYDFKIFSCNFACFSNIFHIRHFSALTCQNQYFLQTWFCDLSHFCFNFLCIQLCPADAVMTVESTVNTVVFTIICNIKWCKKADRITKMIFFFHLCALCHFFNKRLCRRWQQRCKIFWCTVSFCKCPPYIFRCVTVIIICLHYFNHLFCDIGSQRFHPRQICHMIDSCFFLVFLYLVA